jgi:hypothetical protein
MPLGFAEIEGQGVISQSCKQGRGHLRINLHASRWGCGNENAHQSPSMLVLVPPTRLKEEKRRPRSALKQFIEPPELVQERSGSQGNNFFSVERRVH